VFSRENPWQKNIFPGLSIRVRNKSQTVAHPTNCWSSRSGEAMFRFPRLFCFKPPAGGKGASIAPLQSGRVMVFQAVGAS